MASVTSRPVYMMPSIAAVHPPHLDGDPSLATEILPGPPSIASVQQSIQKRDPRKPGMTYSYLPTVDPGTTYTGPPALLGAPTTTEVVSIDGPRSKRARLDKGKVNRAQRAAARSFAAQGSAPPRYDPQSPALAPFAYDHDPVANEEEVGAISTAGEGVLPSRPSRKRDKGKGKEVEGVVKVKEEPRVVSLLSPEPSLSVANEDHCSSCRSYGALVYCDGCPRAFHFWCLDPPMEATDIPSGESRWFCPACLIRKNPPPKPPPSLLSPLLQHLQNLVPTEYQLPEDIKSFFKDVNSAPNGMYVDGSEVKHSRLNRFGQIDERDVTKLKDKNGLPVLCFQCGMSAIPIGRTASNTVKRPRRSTAKAASNNEWHSIISCDYCDLHWHIDCLDPPPTTLPPLNRKWMCPNHIEHISNAQLRIPKQNCQPIEISQPGQFNNGNIEVTHPQIASTSATKVVADEVLINGRRYRVPERMIVLDFWGKLGKYVENDMSQDTAEIQSGVSSPLTSLSSLEDIGDPNPPISTFKHDAVDSLKAAEILCGLRHARRTTSKKMVVRGIQTEPVDTPHVSDRKTFLAEPVIPLPAATPSTRKSNGRPKRKGRVSELAAKPAPVTRRARPVTVEPSSRELRSSRRQNKGLTSANGHVNVKKEELDDPPSISGFTQNTPAKAQIASYTNVPIPNSPSREKVKRGKKRKAMDDEGPAERQDKTRPLSSPDRARQEKEKRVFIRSPNRSGQDVSVTSTAQAQAGGHPSTPTLKIRLPRLSSLSSATSASKLAAAAPDANQ